MTGHRQTIPCEKRVSGSAIRWPAPCCITVRGTLDEGWTEWFDGLRIVPDGDGDTVLTGVIRDQAALYGILLKIRDMGLPLLSVQVHPPGVL